MKCKYSVGSLFAGIGGICLGFKNAGCRIAWANEIDHAACETYRHNIDLFGGDKSIVYECDIVDFEPPSVKIDIMTGGFPCQPYSLAGSMKGFDDKRGAPMFNEIINKSNICKPRVLFLENVSFLKNINKGSVFNSICMSLKEKAEYNKVFTFTMNSQDYGGIAQNRDRLYFVAIRRKDDTREFEKLARGLKKPVEITKHVKDIVDIEDTKPQKYYYSSENAKHFNDHFFPAVKEKGVVYQYRRTYMRENKNNLCPTLTASMGTGGHNVPIILDNNGIRKLTPEECLAFQGFPRFYEFPKGGNCAKYKQIGNSVTVPVVEHLAGSIVYALDQNED